MSQHVGNCFLGAKERAKRLAVEVLEKVLRSDVKKGTPLSAPASVANQEMHWPQFVAHTSEGLLDLLLIGNVGGPEDATLRCCAKSHADLIQGSGLPCQRYDSVPF